MNHAEATHRGTHSSALIADLPPTRYWLTTLLCTGTASVAWMSPSPLAAAPDPKFRAQTIDDAVEIGYGLAVGDVDGDGRTDVLLADKREIVWYRAPDWMKFVLARNLTLRDNVCLAARDIDGDGKVEVAVGGNWNPGETSDRDASGATFYLVPASDRTTPWQAIPLPHDPTVHRMHWIRTGEDTHALAVLPLHGIGNRDGAGTETVRLAIHHLPDDASDPEAWAAKTEFVDTGLHMTHNFDILPAPDRDRLLVAGAEGARIWDGADWITMDGIPGSGEIRRGNAGTRQVTATIEPMHGHRLAVQEGDERTVLDESFNQGHALAVDDVLGIGRPSIVAGWRNPNSDGKVGIRLYWPEAAPDAAAGSPPSWKTAIVDDNTMACEDLRLHDLDGDGDPDIVAAGRATNNLVIYWNESERTPTSR